MQDYIMLFIIYINVMIINYIQCKRKQIKCTIYPNGVVFLDERREVAYVFIQKVSHVLLIFPFSSAQIKSML